MQRNGEAGKEGKGGMGRKKAGRQKGRRQEGRKELRKEGREGGGERPMFMMQY